MTSRGSTSGTLVSDGINIHMFSEAGQGRGVSHGVSAPI